MEQTKINTIPVKAIKKLLHEQSIENKKLLLAERKVKRLMEKALKERFPGKGPMNELKRWFIMDIFDSRLRMAKASFTRNQFIRLANCQKENK